MQLKLQLTLKRSFKCLEQFRSRNKTRYTWKNILLDYNKIKSV